MARKNTNNRNNTNGPSSGITRLPSGNVNPTEEISQNTERIEDTNEQLIELITGAMSAMLLGKINKNGNLESMLSSKSNGEIGLLDLMSNQTNFISRGTNFFDTTNSVLLEMNTSLRSIEGILRINQNSNSNNTNQAIQNTNATQHTIANGQPNAMNGFNGLIEFLNKLNYDYLPIDSETVKQNLKNLTALLEDEKFNENFKSLITTINGLITTNQNNNDTTNAIKNVNSLFEYVNKLISTIEKLTDIKTLSRLMLVSISFNTFVSTIRKKVIPGILKLQSIGTDIVSLNGISDNLKGIDNTLQYIASIMSSFGQINEIDIDDVNDSIDSMSSLFSNDGKLSQLKDAIIAFLSNINNDNNISAASKSFKETLNNLFFILSFKDKSVDDISDAVDFMKELTKEYGKFFEDLKKSVFGEESLSTLELIQNNTEKLKETLEKYNSLLKSFGTLSMINAIIGLGLARDSVGIITEFIEGINEIEYDSKNLKSFNKLIEKHILPIITNLMKVNEFSMKDIVSVTMKMNLLAKLFKNSNKAINALSSKIENVSIDALVKSLNKFADGLKVVVEKFDAMNISKIKEALEIVDKFEKLIIKLSLILVIAAAASLINFTQVFVMATSLSMLLLSIGATMKMFSEISNDAMVAADDAMKLVLVSGLILAIAALTVDGLGDIGNILLFGVVLTAFLWGISKVFEQVAESKAFKKSLKGSEDAMKIVAIAGAILVLGGMLFRFVKFTDALGFTVLLAGFILAISLPFALFSNSKKFVFSGAKDFGELVAFSGATLLLGALLYKNIPASDIIGFGLLLTGFILAITAAYALAAVIANKKTLEISKELSNIIAISGAILIAAGLVMGLRDDMWKDVMLFALTLGIFISAISLSMGLASKIAKEKALAAMGVISIVTVTIGGLLLFGAYMIGKNPKMLENIALFGAEMLAFVGINALIIWGLSQIKPVNLLGATLALIGIGILTVLMGSTMELLSEVANNTDFDKLDKLLIRMAAIFVPLIALVAGVAAGFGLLSSSGLGWVAIGGAVVGIAVAEAALFGLIKIVDLAAEAMSHLGQAAQDIDKMNGLDFKTMGKNLKDFITAVTGAVDVLDKGRNWIEWLGGGLGKASNALGYAAKFGAIIVMANAVKSIALSIKEWSEAFPEGTDNKKINAIGTTMVAIISAFTEPLKDSKIKSMFEIDWKTGKAPINQMMKAYKDIGSVLTNIATGVQAWASLRVPIYDKDGNIKEYISLKDVDLDNASKNIKTVIKSIGEALVEAADSDVFKTGLIGGDSKALQAAKAIAIVSDTLSTVADTIGAYIKGEFPVLKLVDGKLEKVGLVKYDPNNNDEVTNTISGIFGAISKGIESASNSLYGHYNITQVATAIKDVSEALHTIIGVIEEIASFEAKGINLDNTQESFKTTLTGLFNFISIFDEDASKDRNGAWGWIVDWWSGKQSKSEYIVSVVDDIVDMSNALNTLSSSITSFVESIKGIVTPFEENKEILDMLNGPESSVNTFIYNIMSSIADKEKGIIPVMDSYIQVLSGLMNGSSMSDSSMRANRIKNIFDRIRVILSNFMESMKGIRDEFGQYSFEDLSLIDNVFDTYNKMLQSMSLFTRFDNTISRESLVRSIQILDEISKVMKDADQVPSKGLMTLGTNMGALSMALDSLPNENNLAKGKKALKEYVKEIESINVAKITSFINLVNSLDNLALRLGTLDSFTDSFAHKITEVLSDLTEQLSNAKTTIESAHSLDERRKTLINDSINKIKEMMKDDITVKISTDDSGTSIRHTGFENVGGGYQQPSRTATPFGFSGGSGEGSSEQIQVPFAPSNGTNSDPSIEKLIVQIQALIDTLNKTQKQER